MTDETGSARTLPYSDSAYAANSVQITVADKAARPTYVPEGPQRSGAILSTARTPNGAPVENIDDSTVVTVGGLAMRVKTAVDEGFLSVDPATGEYSEVSPEVRSARAQRAAAAAQAEAAKHAVILSEESESDLSDIERGLSEMGLDAASVVGELLGRRAMPEALNELARRWEVDSAEMKARINAMLGDLGYVIHEKLLAPAGIDSASWNDWLANGPEKHRVSSAGVRAILGSDLEGYRYLVRRYLETRGYARPAAKEDKGVMANLTIR